MSDPPSYDDDLLARLNALKKSRIQLNPSKYILSYEPRVTNAETYDRPKPIFENPTQPTPEVDLSARLRSLRNGSLSPSPSPAVRTPQSASRATSVPTASLGVGDEDDPLRGDGNLSDKTLDELLADLGPDYQWKLDPDDPDDIQKLLQEAREALPRDGAEPSPEAASGQGGRDKTKGKSRGGKEYLTRDLDMLVFALDDEDGKAETAKHSNLEDESRESQDIVARILDEVNLERQNEPPEEEESHRRQSEEGDEEELSLPSAPSQLPELPPTEPAPSKRSLDFESDIAARMAALKGLGNSATNELGLPSAPTFKPIDKAGKGVIKKKFMDEEIESWCIICQDDATVKCLGCGGDLYCASCWKEGHMGPEVGWEERRHKWTKFRKPS